MVSVVRAVVLGCVLVNHAFAKQNGDYTNLAQRAGAEYLAGQISASEASLIAALRSLQPGEDTARAATLSELGTLYFNKDELSKAEHVYLESLEIYRRLSDQNHIGGILSNLGAVYSAQRRDDYALEVLRRALKLANANFDANPALTVEVLNRIGIAYFRQGKYGKAENFLTQSRDLALKAGISVRTPQFLHNLAVIYYQKREFRKAEDLFVEALRLTEANIGLWHPDLTFVLSSLGDVYREAGKCSQAEQQYQRALTILQTDKSDFSIRIARLLRALSLTYTKCGRKADAQETMAQAVVIARRNLAGHGDMVNIVESYSVALKHEGKVREANELWREAELARIAAGLVVNVRKPF